MALRRALWLSISSISSRPGPELELLLFVPPLLVPPVEPEDELVCPPSLTPEELD
jgi:hypothetical protein